MPKRVSDVLTALGFILAAERWVFESRGTRNNDLYPYLFTCLCKSSKTIIAKTNQRGAEPPRGNPQRHAEGSSRTFDLHPVVDSNGPVAVRLMIAKFVSDPMTIV